MRTAGILAALLIAGLIFNHYFGQENDLPDETAPVTQQEKKKEAAEKKLAKLYAQPRKPVAELVEESPQKEAKKETLDPGCVSLWDNLRNMPLDSLETVQSMNDVPSAGECDQIPDPLKDVQNAYLDFCARLDDPKTAELSEDQIKDIQIGCQVAILRYRGSVTDYLTQGKSLNEIDDPVILSDKLLAKLLQMPSKEGGPPDFAGTAAIADRMLEIDPSLTPLTKISAGSNFVQTLPKSENDRPLDPSSPLWEQTDAAIRRAREADPDNPQLDDVELWSNTRGLQLDRLRNQLDQMDPGNPTYQYYSAYHDFESGNREAALRSLREGAERYPNDPRFMAARPFIDANGNGRFPINMNMDVDLESTMKRMHN